jgi:membrane-bound ClpP family serine protease
MSKTLGYVGAALLFLLGLPIVCFGLFYIWASFAPGANANWAGTGIITALVGFLLVAGGIMLIWMMSRQKAAEAAQNVTMKVELPGQIGMETVKCKSCGGVIASENIQIVNGAPVVTCQYCHTVYQLTEEPKW